MDTFQAITLDTAVNLIDVNKAQLQQILPFTSLVQSIFYQCHPCQFFQLLFLMYESFLFCLLPENLIFFLD